MPGKRRIAKATEEKYKQDIIGRRRDSSGATYREMFGKLLPVVVGLMNEGFEYGNRIWEQATDQRNFIVCYRCPNCGRATIGKMERFPMVDVDTNVANTRSRVTCEKSHNNQGCGFEVEIVCEAKLNYTYERSLSNVDSSEEDWGEDQD